MNKVSRQWLENLDMPVSIDMLDFGADSPMIRIETFLETSVHYLSIETFASLFDTEMGSDFADVSFEILKTAIVYTIQTYHNQDLAEAVTDWLMLRDIDDIDMINNMADLLDSESETAIRAYMKGTI